MFIRFFSFILLTLTVTARSMFLVCCKYYLCQLVYTVLVNKRVHYKESSDTPYAHL